MKTKIGRREHWNILPTKVIKANFIDAFNFKLRIQGSITYTFFYSLLLSDILSNYESHVLYSLILAKLFNQVAYKFSLKN